MDWDHLGNCKADRVLFLFFFCFSSLLFSPVASLPSFLFPSFVCDLSCWVRLRFGRGTAFIPLEKLALPCFCCGVHVCPAVHGKCLPLLGLRHTAHAWISDLWALTASYSLDFCFYRFASPLSCRTLAKSSWEFHPVITSTVEKKQEPLIVALRSDAIPPNGLFNLAPLLGGNTMTERRKPVWLKCIYLHLLTGLGWGWDRKACLTIGSNWDNCGREVRIWKDWLLRHTGECHTTGVLSTNTFILVYWGWTEIKSWES